MASRLVTGYLKHVAALLEALRTHGPVILAAVRAETATETAPAGVDCTPLFTHASAIVQQRVDALVEADQAHQDELADDGLPRDARDDAALALNQAVVQLKKSAASLFGDAWIKRLNFPAEVPHDPAQIEAVGAQLIRTLQNTTLPKSQLPGVDKIDKGAWIHTLQGPYDRLTAARRDVTREEQEARATLTARDKALDELVSAAVTAVQITQGLARLGKVSHLVEGLRGTLPTTASSREDDAPAPTPDAKPASPVAPA